MEKILLMLILFSIHINLFAQVNGVLEEIEGKKVLTVWGTHYERGYAHGYLLGKEIRIIIMDYMVGYICSGSSENYGYARTFFLNNFTIENKYQIEADAMIQAMNDKGTGRYISTLGRTFDATDILMMTAIIELYEALFLGVQLGCSSFSSWGTSTIEDSTLSGNLVITRLMDWHNHPALHQNHLLMINIPSEPDEQKWISINFVGVLGALSAINESGVAAFKNSGSNSDYQTGNTFYPIFFTIRNGIEMNDYNQDNENNPNDIVQAIKDRNRCVGSIIHVTKNTGINSNPLIIECNNVKGVTVRNVSHNTLVAGENLVATNHFRTLYTPEGCMRYRAIVDSLNRSAKISPERNWSIIKNSASVSRNLEAIQYIPSIDSLKLATSTTTSPAYLNKFTSFCLSDLFNTPTAIKDENYTNQVTRYVLEQNYPNPFNSSTVFSYQLPANSHVEITIYSITGQKISTLISEQQQAGNYNFVWDGSDFASGVYFYRLKAKVSKQTGGASKSSGQVLVGTNKLILLK